MPSLRILRNLLNFVKNYCNMLYIILYLSLFIGLISYLIYGFYSYHKFCKAEKKEWEDFLDSLVPGSTWILHKKPNINPFVEPSSDIIVTIIETRKNSYGDIWVRYKSKNAEYLRDKEASDFKKLYKKLN